MKSLVNQMVVFYIHENVLASLGRKGCRARCKWKATCLEGEAAESKLLIIFSSLGLRSCNSKVTCTQGESGSRGHAKLYLHELKNTYQMMCMRRSNALMSSSFASFGIDGAIICKNRCNAAQSSSCIWASSEASVGFVQP